MNAEPTRRNTVIFIAACSFETRSDEPQMSTIRYAGTTTISQSTRKRNMSRTRNAPVTPPMTMRRRTKYSFTRFSTCHELKTAASPTTPERSSMGSEMPSTPSA